VSKEKHRFYAPPDSFSENGVLLSEDESRHALKVLRVEEGERITVIDGVGGTFLVEVGPVTRKRVSGLIIERTENEGESGSPMHIALSILNQPARWETFLEKAVELGCSRITPLISQRTQSPRLKMRRMHSIVISALKQSGRSRMPQLDEPTKLDDLLEVGEGMRIICHESSPDAKRLDQILGEQAPGASTTALIGPEGGFSEGEVARANEQGWTTVWLGPRRLRAETAAITVAATISQHLDG